MPLHVKDLILKFLYSFDACAFTDRYIKVLMFDKSVRPFLPSFAIAKVPGIHTLRREEAFARRLRDLMHREKLAGFTKFPARDSLSSSWGLP